MLNGSNGQTRFLHGPTVEDDACDAKKGPASVSRNREGYREYRSPQNAAGGDL